DGSRPRPHPFPTRRSSDLRRMGSEASCPAERRGWRLTEFRGLPPRISPRVNAVARIHGLAQRRDGPLGIRVGDLDPMRAAWETTDRKSTRLNSSHVKISYA